MSRIIFKYKEYELIMEGFGFSSNRSFDEDYLNWLKEIKLMEEKKE